MKLLYKALEKLGIITMAPSPSYHEIEKNALTLLTRHDLF